MSNHTPGPWTTDESPNEQDDYCIWTADGTFLANVGNGEKSVESEERPQGGDCIAFDVTARTNAKLMAAAPDLYTLAEHVRDCNHEGPGPCPACQAMARAALAKARES